MSSRRFQPELLRMSHYQAPAVAEVRPFVIPARTAQVELVTGGVIHFRSGGRDMALGCGALFWHIAGEKTIHRTEADDPYVCLSIAFTASSNGKRPVPRLSVIQDHQRTRDLSAELLRAYHDDAVDRAILGSYAYARLVWEAHLGNIRRTVSERPVAIDAALEFLESAFRAPGIGVGDLAGAAGISAPHLFELFRKHLGQTPHQLLIARRIREAKWLLSGTGQTIKAIAQDCGFHSIETFYRAFKRTVGVTPHHFRSIHSLPVLDARRVSGVRKTG